MNVLVFGGRTASRFYKLATQKRIEIESQKVKSPVYFQRIGGFTVVGTTLTQIGIFGNVKVVLLVASITNSLSQKTQRVFSGFLVMKVRKPADKWINVESGLPEDGPLIVVFILPGLWLHALHYRFRFCVISLNYSVILFGPVDRDEEINKEEWASPGSCCYISFTVDIERASIKGPPFPSPPP